LAHKKFKVEEMDVPFGGPKASPVARKSFNEAKEYIPVCHTGQAT
jgi:hypothetical protein